MKEKVLNWVELLTAVAAVIGGIGEILKQFGIASDKVKETIKAKREEAFMNNKPNDYCCGTQEEQNKDPE